MANKIIIKDIDKLMSRYGIYKGMHDANSILKVNEYDFNEFIFNEFEFHIIAGCNIVNGKLENIADPINKIKLLGNNKVEVETLSLSPKVNYKFTINDINLFSRANDSNYAEIFNRTIKLDNRSKVNLNNFYNYNKVFLSKSNIPYMSGRNAKEFSNNLVIYDMSNILKLMCIIMREAKERAIRDRAVKNVTGTGSISENNCESNELIEARAINKIFMFDEIVDYASKHIPQYIRKEFKCECWGVRGHYRRLKSGKIVFVRPYTKGKNKNKEDQSNKEYLTDRR